MIGTYSPGAEGTPLEQVTQTSSDDEQWDVVRTITELESLKAHTERVMQHTLKRMGIRHGVDYDGAEIIEHPLGQAMYAVSESLKACYSKYGKDLYKEALNWNGMTGMGTPDE